jgi:hypothetical protein
VFSASIVGSFACLAGEFYALLCTLLPSRIRDGCFEVFPANIAGWDMGLWSATWGMGDSLLLASR